MKVTSKQNGLSLQYDAGNKDIDIASLNWGTEKTLALNEYFAVAVDIGIALLTTLLLLSCFMCLNLLLLGMSSVFLVCGFCIPLVALGVYIPLHDQIYNYFRPLFLQKYVMLEGNTDIPSANAFAV